MVYISSCIFLWNFYYLFIFVGVEDPSVILHFFSVFYMITMVYLKSGVFWLNALNYSTTEFNLCFCSDLSRCDNAGCLFFETSGVNHGFFFDLALAGSHNYFFANNFGIADNGSSETGYAGSFADWPDC